MHNKNAAPIAAAPLNGLKLAPSLQKLTLNYGVGDKQGASGIQMWQHGNFPPNAVAPDNRLRLYVFGGQRNFHCDTYNNIIKTN